MGSSVASSFSGVDGAAGPRTSMNGRTSWRSSRASVARATATGLVQSVSQLGIDLRHSGQEHEDRLDEFDEAQCSDHLLEPSTDSLDVGGEG